MEKDKGLILALKAAGGSNRLAAKLHISSAAVAQWWRVPAERLIQVERITGVPRNKLRPDLYQRSTHWPDAEPATCT